MMLNWDRKHTVILVAILFVLIIVGIFSFYRFVVPKQDEVDLLKKEIAIQNDLIDQENAIDQEFQVASEEVKTLQMQLPSEIVADRLLLQLREMERASNVTLTKITSDAERKLTEAYPVLSASSFQLEIDADNYVDMNSFLVNIHNNEQLMEVNHLEYTVSNGRISATMIITAFYNAELANL